MNDNGENAHSSPVAPLVLLRLLLVRVRTLPAAVVRPRWIAICVGAFLNAAPFPAPAQSRVDLPPSTAGKWHLDIRLNFCGEAVQRIAKKRFDAPYPVADLLFLWVDSDSSLRGPKRGRLLSGESRSVDLGQTLAFIPQMDLAAIYTNAFCAMESFADVNSIWENYSIASGLEVTFDFRIEGRPPMIKRKSIREGEPVSKQLQEVLSILYRHLPRQYGKVFEYLRIPKSRSRPGPEAHQYRKCPRHDEWMKANVVRVVYGLMIMNEQYSIARQELFPNANPYTSGGSVELADSPKSEKALFCHRCRQAEKEWSRRHGRSR